MAEYSLQPAREWPRPIGPLQFRTLIAAAHAVADPLQPNPPGSEANIDWEATLAYRRHLWSFGLGVAEAMDTAQRGMGLGWSQAAELIERSLADAAPNRGRIVCGAGTDQLPEGSARDLDEVAAAYLEQCAFIEERGGAVVIMASRELARLARGPDDYHTVYERVLRGLRRPAILHWLGPMFDPKLAGYWGGPEPEAAMRVCLDLIRANVDRIDGIKISLLDDSLEITMRRQLPNGVRMYTGDDFGFATLIRGDSEGHSDALLGILDAIAPVAASAVMALADGDQERYDQLLEPTVPLSRLIFSSPTYYYKTGITLLAYVNGFQSHFHMLGGYETARSVLHLAEVFRLADQAGLLSDPELAGSRMQHVLALAGLE